MPKRSNEAKQSAGATGVEETSALGIADLLKHYGISTIQSATYEWGAYRYTNPSDAIAAAKRGEAA